MNSRSPSKQRALFQHISEASSSALPRFLERQRWFASKARTIERADLADGVWLDDEVLLSFVRVGFRQGEDETYSLLLKLAPELKGTSALGTVDHEGEKLPFGEASSDVLAGTALVEALFRGEDLASVQGGALRAGERDAELDGPPAELVLTVLAAEQSNTSLRVGTDFVFKLFRKLQKGENPELEVSRYLWKKTGFRAMPGFRGAQTMRFAEGDEATLSILQDWVPNQGDGWAYVIGSLPARTQEVQLALSRDIHRLGAITAEFHWALAGASGEPGFSPEPLSESDLATWKEFHRRRAQDVFHQLAEKQSNLPVSARDLWNVVERGQDLLSDGSELSCSGDHGFQKIRVHGDFHLGQTLKTETDFVLFDFEGEPARALKERRWKTSALKDVAGMLRSLDYAVEFAHRADPSSRELGHESSTGQLLRTSFLSGYFSNTFERGAPFLPKSRRAVQGWLDFFEMEKVVYELGYEMNNRPDWVWIPLKGAARLLERRVA